METVVPCVCVMLMLWAVQCEHETWMFWSSIIKCKVSHKKKQLLLFVSVLIFTVQNLKIGFWLSTCFSQKMLVFYFLLWVWRIRKKMQIELISLLLVSYLESNSNDGNGGHKCLRGLAMFWMTIMLVMQGLVCICQHPMTMVTHKHDFANKLFSSKNWVELIVGSNQFNAYWANLKLQDARKVQPVQCLLNLKPQDTRKYQPVQCFLSLLKTIRRSS